MFSINSYLHIPTKKVIKKGINGYSYVGGEEGEIQGLFTEDTEGGLLLVAPLSECRPLLTVTNIRQEIFTECDVFHLRYRLKKKWFDQYSIIFFNGFFMDEVSFLFDKDYIRRDYSTYVEAANLDIIPSKFYGKGAHKKKIGSFFDNPAHYSKFLWGCSEEEGLNEVFNLLKINL